MPFDFACPDWADRLAAGKTPIADLSLDLAEAARAVAIYNKLRLPDVAGKPALAQAGGEWFRDIIRAVFGSVDAVTGERGVGEVFCLVPKKNSKTNGIGTIC
jgi:phage terminase large subunit-like protein